MIVGNVFLLVDKLKIRDFKYIVNVKRIIVKFIVLVYVKIEYIEKEG